MIRQEQISIGRAEAWECFRIENSAHIPWYRTAASWDLHIMSVNEEINEFFDGGCSKELRNPRGIRIWTQPEITMDDFYELRNR
jgi:hypothetical protein